MLVIWDISVSHAGRGTMTHDDRITLAAACIGLLAFFGHHPEARAAAAAQTRLSEALGFSTMKPQAAADCSGGLHYDDGTFEDAVSVPRTNGLQVMSFEVPANASGIQQVCAALTRLPQAPTADLSLNVVFYAADGPAGSPGTLLASVPATAAAVPVTTGNTVNAQFYSFNIGSGLTLPAARTLYVGLEFDGSQGFFIGIDDSATTPYRDAFVSNDGGISWQTQATATPGYRAYGLRVQPSLAATNCVPSSTAMCLQAQRFEVTATYKASDGSAGSAQTVPLTTDSGYLWFFAASNIEAIVKVLDACALNGHYWVFAGGLTNVQTVLTITDTQTGSSRTYTNPIDTAYQPIQDTAALPCP
jgi:hypothetical protein